MFAVITSEFGSFNNVADEFEDYKSAFSLRQELLNSGDITDERQIWIIWLD